MPLALLAALLPDRMLALVMGEVERMANDPLPLAQRAPRVAALERELDDLHRVEEALVVAAIAAGQPVHRIIREKNGISADTALRLAAYFHTTPEFWLNLQSKFELEMARRENGIARKLHKIEEMRVA